MSTAKHTAGPWRVVEDATGAYIVGADWPDNGVVARVNMSRSPGVREAADGAQNAARIVACVNACEGIDDPAAVREAIDLLERVYLANKCPGIVNGEAALCPAYADRARDLLVQLGRKP